MAVVAAVDAAAVAVGELDVIAEIGWGFGSACLQVSSSGAQAPYEGKSAW